MVKLFSKHSNKLDRVRQLIKYERKWMKENPVWTISVDVPEAAGPEFHEKLFLAMSDLAFELEEELPDRKWDLFVSSIKGHGSIPLHLVEEAIQ